MPIEKSPNDISYFQLDKSKIDAALSKRPHIGIAGAGVKPGDPALQEQDLKQIQEVYERILKFYSKFGINTMNAAAAAKNHKFKPSSTPQPKKLRTIKSS